MFVKRKPDIIFRKYPQFGYLTDNRNYGYDTAIPSTKWVGECLISLEGCVFYEALTQTPQSIDELSVKIAKSFKEVNSKTILYDVKTFFEKLFIDGFVLVGDSYDSCGNLYSSFSYDSAPIINKQLSNGIEIDYSSYFGHNPILTSVQITISGICNEKCVHCYLPPKDKKSIIRDSLFYDIIEQCKSMNVNNITFGGGEPMLHPNIREYLAKCKDNNFSVNILSNLTVLTKELLNDIANYPLCSVQTSLYSLIPSIHDSITGVNGSCEITKRNIALLRSYNVPMQINCPILKQNQNCYQDVIDWANKLNIEASSDFYIFSSYDGEYCNLSYRLNIEEVRFVINREMRQIPFIEKLRLAVKENSKLSGCDSVCTVCRHRICISYDGTVYPCEGWQNNQLGNIENNNLEDIWSNSPKVLELRTKQLKDFESCCNCIYRNYCNICMMRNSNEDSERNPKAPSAYFCAIAKMLYECDANNEVC